MIGKVTAAHEKENLVNGATVASEKQAAADGSSLALIRPQEPELTWKRRSHGEIAEAREAFESQARQASMFDKELDVIEPCPFRFTMSYRDDHGPHKKTCADWETSAAFFNLSRSYEESDVLEHLRNRYCFEYVKTGLVFALGNIAARPQTWQLLGIFPCKDIKQTTFEF